MRALVMGKERLRAMDHELKSPEERARYQILERLLADCEGGGLRPLEDYLAIFPGSESLVIQEYEALGGTRRAETPEPGPPALGLSQPAGGTTASTPDRFGSYRLLHDRDGNPIVLGTGGQGVVYLGEQPQLGRRVAIKVMAGGGIASEDALCRFRREAQVAARLQHPGICPVLDTGFEARVPYIVMPLVEGESLAQSITTARRATPTSSTAGTSGGKRARRGVPTPPDSTVPSGPATGPEISAALALIEAAARALHVAHEAGIIHRDIKPGNIMVTPEGQPVLMDFGLARELESEGPSLTRAGDFFGTPAYMSPEQLEKNRIRLDGRTDVYSLGVTLFELLSLRRPFEAPTAEALYHAIRTEESPPLCRLNRAVPADVAVVVATAMEKDRDRRYQTALAFAEDLRRIRNHEPILARPVSRWTKLVRWAQRNPAVASLTAAVFVVLVAGLATTLAQKARADANAAEARLNLTEFERLADARRLDDLIREQEEDLWPALPSKVPAMVAWLDRARKLVARLDDHATALTDLRSRAKPWTDEQREKDRESHAADLALLAGLEERIAQASAEMKTVAASTMRESRKEELTEKLNDELEEARIMLAAERARIEPRLAERLTFDFDDPTLVWRQEKLAELVKRLQAFKESGPREAGITSVVERLAFAQTLEEQTILDQQEAWSACLARIAAKNSKYGPGTLTKPELGLIPLGPDRVSGFEEFAETATGVPPVRDPTTGKLVVTEATGVVLVLLPEGTFWMSAQKLDPNRPNFDPEAESDEGPTVEVTLSPFFLSKYELTRGQWLRSSGANEHSDSWGAFNRSKIVDLRHPAEQVSWADCQRVLPRFSLSLPTESQWEYGCRAGTSTPWWVGRDRTKLQEAANLADADCKASIGPATWKCEPWEDGFAEYAPSGSFAANGFGLHDVHGNVWEWCADGHSGYLPNPARPGDGLKSVRGAKHRIARGGGYYDVAALARSANRLRIDATLRDGYVGVRPARRVHR